MLCDTEPLLSTAASVPAYKSKRITWWHVPPKSPGINPVEKFRGRLRRGSWRLDLGDLREGHPAMTKALYRQRARYLCESQRAQRVAGALAKNLHAVCREVVRKRGARARA